MPAIEMDDFTKNPPRTEPMFFRTYYYPANNEHIPGDIVAYCMGKVGDKVTSERWIIMLPDRVFHVLPIEPPPPLQDDTDAAGLLAMFDEYTAQMEYQVENGVLHSFSANIDVEKIAAAYHGGNVPTLQSYNEKLDRLLKESP